MLESEDTKGRRPGPRPLTPSLVVVWGAQTNKQVSSQLPEKLSPAFSSRRFLELTLPQPQRIERKGWV